jgi:hypothetical protein
LSLGLGESRHYWQGWQDGFGGVATQALAAREVEDSFAEMSFLRQLVTRALALTFHPTQKSGAFGLRFL